MSGPVPRARLLAPTAENIAWAAESLRRGEIGGMPTETVYGLAGNGLDPLALARIFDAKERPRFDPLILHIPASWLVLSPPLLAVLQDRGLVDTNRLPAEARLLIEKLIKNFWPGPLTLVLPKLSSVPDLATSGLPSVALRMPRHPQAQALLEAAGIPLAAPSANRFGRISPTRARHVIEELGNRIGWVLEGGACEIGVESTVLAWSENDGFRLLRPGGLPASEIEAVLGSKLSAGLSSNTRGTPDSKGMAAPGMLDSHYSPAKSLTLLSTSLERFDDVRLEAELRAALHAGSEGSIGLLAFTGDPQALSSRFLRLTGRSTVVRILARDGSLDMMLHEAARGLFAELRALDASSAEILFAEPAPSLEGLGYAIQDRLTRASAKREP